MVPRSEGTAPSSSYNRSNKVRWHTCLTSDAVREGPAHVLVALGHINTLIPLISFCQSTTCQPTCQSTWCDVIDSGVKTTDVTPTSRPWRHRLVDKCWLTEILLSFYLTKLAPKNGLYRAYKPVVGSCRTTLLLGSKEGTLVKWGAGQIGWSVMKSTHKAEVCFYVSPNLIINKYRKGREWYFMTVHGPDFTCNFPQTVLRPTETDQSQIYPKLLLCFHSHLLVNISRCSSLHLSVISSKHCLCLQLELRPTGTAVRLKNPDYLGLYPTTVSKMPGGVSTKRKYTLVAK